MYCMSIYLYIRYMWHIYMYWGTVRMYICVYVRICMYIYIYASIRVYDTQPLNCYKHTAQIWITYIMQYCPTWRPNWCGPSCLIIIICLFPSKRRGLSQPWLKGQCPLSWSYHELCDSQGSEKNRKAEARHQQIGVKPAKISRQIPLYNCS